MHVPQVNDRVKEAPAQVLRAVFAGIGQLMSTADKIRNKPASAEAPATPKPAAPEPAPAKTAAQETVGPEPAAPEPAAPDATFAGARANNRRTSGQYHQPGLCSRQPYGRQRGGRWLRPWLDDCFGRCNTRAERSPVASLWHRAPSHVAADCFGFR